jgi:hypothetical protein
LFGQSCLCSGPLLHRAYTNHHFCRHININKYSHHSHLQHSITLHIHFLDYACPEIDVSMSMSSVCVCVCASNITLHFQYKKTTKNNNSCTLYFSYTYNTDTNKIVVNSVEHMINLDHVKLRVIYSTVIANVENKSISEYHWSLKNCTTLLLTRILADQQPQAFSLVLVFLDFVLPTIDEKMPVNYFTKSII